MVNLFVPDPNKAQKSSDLLGLAALLERMQKAPVVGPALKFMFPSNVSEQIQSTVNPLAAVGFGAEAEIKALHFHPARGNPQADLSSFRNYVGRLYDAMTVASPADRSWMLRALQSAEQAYRQGERTWVAFTDSVLSALHKAIIRGR